MTRQPQLSRGWHLSAAHLCEQGDTQALCTERYSENQSYNATVRKPALLIQESGVFRDRAELR